MTTRLKILSGLLVFSIIYAAVTSIFDSRNKKTKGKTIPVQAETATNTSALSSEESDDIVIVNDYKSFKTAKGISDKMVSWGTNPFRDRKSKRKINKSSTTNKTLQPAGSINNSIPSQSDYLKIESVAVIGDIKIVIINGDRYREGEVINNLFIEKIERERITFRSGKTRIIKNVGT